MSTTALAAVLAKLAGLGTAAKATVGLAVAAGAVGAAAGVPMTVHEIANVGGEQVVVSTTDQPTRDVTADPTAEPTDDATSIPGAQEAERFGAEVSTQARTGGVDGQQIAAAAHERNQLREENRIGAEKAADLSGDKDQTGDQDQDQARDRDQTGDQTGDQDQTRDRDQTCDADCTPVGDGPRAGGARPGNDS